MFHRLYLIFGVLAVFGATGVFADAAGGYQAYKTGNFKQAFVEWLPVAEAGDDPRIQYLVGEMYKEGKGVARDEAEAVVWFKRAAMGADLDALMTLSVMYILGEGVEADFALAYMWAAAADARGHDDAVSVMDLLDGKMGEDSGAMARLLAERCIASGYGMCDYDKP